MGSSPLERGRGRGILVDVGFDGDGENVVQEEMGGPYVGYPAKTSLMSTCWANGYHGLSLMVACGSSDTWHKGKIQNEDSTQ